MLLWLYLRRLYWRINLILKLLNIKTLTNASQLKSRLQRWLTRIRINTTAPLGKSYMPGPSLRRSWVGDRLGPDLPGDPKSYKFFILYTSIYVF